MPAIKLKKKTQEYLLEKKREKEAKEAAAPTQTTVTTSTPTPPPKKKKEARLPQTPPAYLNENDILFEKRKRTIPVVEQKCQDWIMDNFEKKEDVYVNINKMYEYYTESILENSGNVADISLFHRIIRDKLGKFYGVKEMSPLNGLVKELKPKEKKVQGETLSLKLKDILNEVITGVGNPNKGVRFFNLKQLVGSKYPALQLETHPNKLLNALERGIRFGNIILVKGTGRCGFYRVPGESTAEEDKPKPKIKKNKGEVEEDGKENENGEASESAKVIEENIEKPKGKSRKKSGKTSEKSADDEEMTPEGGDKEEPKKRGRKRKSGEMEESKGEEQNSEESQEGKKKRQKKSGRPKRKFVLSKFSSEAEKHGNPSRIEDVFPMALTYMSDPKEASIRKISKYMEKYYPEVDTDATLKKALEKGESDDMWQAVGGQTYRLLLEEFNPGYSSDIEDMISQAIMATHEPKTASGKMIKKYILQYHENFMIDKRPHLFKKALEKACSKNIIRQVSGLGSGGSFQLVKPFVPSPAILAGEVEDKADRVDFEIVNDEYDEIYVVRKTKSGRGGGMKERKAPVSRK